MPPSSPSTVDVALPLGVLPALVRDEPALTQVLGTASAVLAVPEPARAIIVAGLARLTSRQPIVVAVPTSADAERLAHDLGAFLGRDEVDLFPAWETLPFERVSPSVEVMGRRLRTMWHLRNGGRAGGAERGRGAPRVVVASVRALVQRLGPHVEDTEPVVVGHGDQLDPTALVAELVAAGYRREELVEHRGEVAVRGSIVDVFPSTADAPVRIDLWGDEVDRLTEFSVADQRSTVDLAEVELFPCRELLATDEVRQRAEALVGREPWGREQWERLSERPHLRRHGVVAAVAHRGRAHPVRPARTGRPGAAGRAPPHARPGGRHPGRGGRPGLHPGRHVGGRGPRLPVAAPALRPAAGPHPGAGVDHHHRAGGPRRGHRWPPPAGPPWWATAAAWSAS